MKFTWGKISTNSKGVYGLRKWHEHVTVDVEEIAKHRRVRYIEL